MRGDRLSIGLTPALAIFAAVLFVTGVSAAADKVLFNFSHKGNSGNFPEDGLVFDAAGNLYGTTQGGTYNDGTVFELMPQADGSWTEKLLHEFNTKVNDGATPNPDLIFDAAGNLYGTTQQGNSGSQGTVFELMPQADGSWTEKILHSFTVNPGKDGYYLLAGLTFDAAGNLYGTADFGGLYSGNGPGTVFELMPQADESWTLKVLHEFGRGQDGVGPASRLVFDGAGNLYGTTNIGGNNGYGTVFELLPKADGGWTHKVLHSFTSPTGNGGSVPLAGLIFDAAGNLYGTTVEGGNSSCVFGDDSPCGTVFELTAKSSGGWSTTKILHKFKGGKDGSEPRASLIFDAAGNLYGTTSLGGAYACGTVFELTPTAAGGWKEKVLHQFKRADKDGCGPLGSLIFDAFGNLYGTTGAGGTHNFGTVFEITP
ncbi:MAG: choice-of-anchor tandem repeat GloVer-containing protein [Terriglobales bacterium]